METLKSCSQYKIPSRLPLLYNMAHVVLSRQAPLLFRLFLGKCLIRPVKKPLFPILYPLLHPLQLPLVLVSLLEEVFCIVVQLHVQVIKFFDPPYSVVVYLYSTCPCAVVLHEWPDEFQIESSLKQVLCFPLELCQAKKGHVSEILLSALQQYLCSLVFWYEGHIIATHQAQVSQHPHLAIVG